jgi:hypothetical protein
MQHFTWKNDTSMFVQHILNAEYKLKTPCKYYTDTLKKGRYMNTMEKFHIHKITKQGLQLNNIHTDLNNPIFDSVTHTPNKSTV